MSYPVLSRLTGLAFGAVLALGAATHEAEAATVVSAGTGFGGFTLTGGSGVIVDADVNTAYNNTATTPPSKWIWDSDRSVNEVLTFTYQFDMTGFDITTASLGGIFQVDNVGTATLNATTMATLGFTEASFQSLNPISAGSSAFVEGINAVVFEVEDLGAPGALRASFVVTADPLTVVPLPAGAPLVLTGLLGLAALRRRAKG